MRIRALFLAFLIVLLPSAYASDIHLRAREHYEKVEVKNLGSTGLSHYEAFTNTLDLWYEVPFRYSFGLAGGPLLATLPLVGHHTDDRPKRIRLLSYGAEAKVFPVPDLFQGFVRGGEFYTSLATRERLGNYYGTSTLIGLGYEWNWKGTGVAPEIDWRFGKLSKDVSFYSLGPAIGLHFYQNI